jgi:ACR3 family arsenite efflux pump ArsB
MEFLVIGDIGRLFGTILLTVGGDFIRHHQYREFSILAGITIIVILLAMIFKVQLERLFRIWHVTSYKNKKTKQISRREKRTSRSKPPSLKEKE